MGDDGVYSSDVSSAKTVTSITIRLFDDNSETDTMLNFPILPDVYDYYIYTSYAQRTTGGSFAPNDIIITDGSGAYEYEARLTDKQHYITRFIDSNANYGIVKHNFVAKLNLVDSSSSPNRIGGITFKGSSGTLKSVQYFELSVFLVPKGDSTAMGNIVSAINNQTGALQGSIGQAADDIQQSIDDQYSGDPETEFSVDDVITQHNEKMGVLSFGSDVMLQFLDMFQSANVGTAELTLPGFNITVENVDYSVWPDYSFNFEQLNEWVPGLMSIIRVMLPAFVWLMVLRYCIKVFDDNFLAK